MNGRIPRKYRDPSGRSPSPKPRVWIAGLLGIVKYIVPVLFLFLIALLGVHILGNGAVARTVSPEIENYSFNPVCRWRGKIKKDESLYIALTEAGISPRVVYDIDRGLDDIFDVRKIQPGDMVMVDLDSLGRMVNFELERSPWKHYNINRNGDTLLGTVDSIPLSYVIRAVKGETKSTLWGSMANLGVPAEAILKFTDILSFDIDFLTETRDGQSFALMYEEYFFEGERIDVGRVIAAHYWLADTNYGGIYYMDPDSTQGYYTLSGKNTKKALLRTPLTYRRISSHFSNSRFHPILKIYRPHHGVDYAAPSGTPVSASGDGTVVYAGWKGGYGNYIEIKHTGGKIYTCYGHLKSYARGIRKGAKVYQGQLIGYVGSTGLSTGPHLDYRVRVGGKYVNPLRYAFPDGPPVKGKYMAEFRARAKDYLALLDVLTPPIKPTKPYEEFVGGEEKN